MNPTPQKFNSVYKSLRMPIQCLQPELYEPKCLCVFVLDTSCSMDICGAIDELNKGLNALNNLIQDPVYRNRLEVAIITFNSSVDIIQDVSLLQNIEIPKLNTNGVSIELNSAINEAIDIVENRKQYYKWSGIPYYCPWIILMTDGKLYPSERDINEISSSIKNDVIKKKYIFSVIGVGEDIDDNILSSLATSQNPALHLNEVNFEDMFFYVR